MSRNKVNNQKEKENVIMFNSKEKLELKSVVQKEINYRNTRLENADVLVSVYDKLDKSTEYERKVREARYELESLYERMIAGEFERKNFDIVLEMYNLTAPNDYAMMIFDYRGHSTLIYEDDEEGKSIFIRTVDESLDIVDGSGYVLDKYHVYYWYRATNFTIQVNGEIMREYIDKKIHDIIIDKIVSLSVSDTWTTGCEGVRIYKNRNHIFAEVEELGGIEND